MESKTSVESQARRDAFGSGDSDFTPTSHPFIDEDDENDDADLGCSDDSDRDAEGGAGSRKRRKKERKVSLSEEEAERKRVLANSQERERMDRLNYALASLRKALPPHFALGNRRLSKIRTLRLAIRYIRDLGNMLAADDAKSERYPSLHHHHHHHHQQHQQQQQQQPLPYHQYPLSHVPQHFHSPPFAPSVTFPGDGSHGDDGYFSSFNESQRLQESSFLGTPYTSTPAHPIPYFHPAVHTASPDDGFGGGNACSFLSPMTDSSMFSADGPSWLASTPTGGHLAGNVAPRTLEESDGCHSDGRKKATFSQPCSPGNGGVAVGVIPVRAPQGHPGSGGILSPYDLSAPVQLSSSYGAWPAQCPPDVTPR